MTATPEQIAGVEVIVDQEEESGITLYRLFEVNERFHLTLSERSENGRMIVQMRLVMAYLRRLDLIPPTPDRVTHRDVINAIKARDGARASHLIGQHINDALELAVKSLLQVDRTSPRGCY
jgi:DNA-binding GntR family transcriptional regulator